MAQHIPTPYTKFNKQTKPMQAYIANETQARKELARLKSIMLWLHCRIAEMEVAGEETWVSIYSDRLAGIRPQVKQIVSYLNSLPA